MSEAQVWDRLARRYDLIVRAFDRSYPAVRARLARDLAGGRILELAAGTGQFTATLLDLADELVATDVSPEMAAQLRARFGEAPGLTIQAMSAYEIEAPAASFDAVICANALHVMDTPGEALAECRRVLRPGGRLVAPTFLHGVSAGRRALSKGLSLVSPFVAKARLDLPGLEALVAAHGFEIMQAEQLPGLFPLGYLVAAPRS